MKTTLHKNVTIALLIISIIIPFSSLCFGQSEEEMRTLRLFYNENELVVSATRHPKPVSQVAENITVISSDDIEAMNAHTVADVLNRIPGLFLSYNQDFGGNSLINLQGSEPRHTLVLVDNIPWNSINEQSAETINIPVGIISRIEIIKGPASSAWGSSLGGVINIITKPVGDTKKPKGSIQASYGKKNSQDYRAELSGKIGKTRYYLYAGTLNSDGLVQSRFSDDESLYSKIEIPFSEDVNTGLSMGYSDTHTGFGDYLDSDINVKGSIRSFFVTPFFTARITRGLDFNMSAYYFRQDFDQNSNSLGLGITGAPGDLYLGNEVKEESWGAKWQVVWKKDVSTLVLGMDFEKGEYDQSINAGALLQSLGVPPVSMVSPGNTKWAFYANDTLAWGKWSVIPGIRYDHESVTGSFVSPSLGVTYKFSKDTVLRGTIARGFSTPSLLWTSGGGLFLDPNPSLKPEEIWSYQVGEETAFSFLWLKANIFLHDVKNSIIGEPLGGGPPAYNDLFINDGKIKRKGFEVEAETAPVYNFSFKGGLTYVDLNHSDTSGPSEIYNCVIAIKYNYNDLKGQLTGYYEWFDPDSDVNYDNFIWDLNINKGFHIDHRSYMEVFAAVHNLFNGFQYSYIENINPRRWLEVGIKYRF